MQVSMLERPRGRTGLICLVLCAFCVALGGVVQAQSTDPTFPTPVGSKEIYGTIAARDIGDARLTDQYYGFVGAPGDLIVTVETKNFNGDFDIFTAGDLRPLLKLTVYAEINSPVTKNVYLRRRENLILRVEGRTPDDDDAVYTIRLSGSFEPIPGGVKLAKADHPETAGDKDATKSRKGNRVSSVGARIEEPPSEVAVAPTPKPTPEPISTPHPAKSEPAQNTPKSTARNTTASGTVKVKPPKPVAKSKPVQTTDDATKKAGDETAKTEPPVTTPSPEPSAEAKNTEPTEKEKKPANTRRSNSKRSSTSTRANPPADDSGARLVIERKDGTHLEYPMQFVTRVTVENGQILVATRDGTLISIPMANVARMSIGP